MSGQKPIEDMITISKELFENNSYVITANYTNSKPRRAVKGLAQGSKISPILFNIFFESIIRMIEPIKNIEFYYMQMILF